MSYGIRVSTNPMTVSLEDEGDVDTDAHKEIHCIYVAASSKHRGIPAAIIRRA